MKQHIALAVLAAALAVGAACGGPIVARPGMQTPAKSRTPAPGNNWPVSPAEAEQLLGKAPLRFRELKATDKGVAGAMKGTVTFPGRSGGLEVKWKPLAPGHVDGWNNSPRKEVAVYEIQKWFLAAGGLRGADHRGALHSALGVPTVSSPRPSPPLPEPVASSVRCRCGSRTSTSRRSSSIPPASRGIRTTRTTSPTSMSSPSWCEHRDGRPGNILVAEDDTNRRVFAVDNGISFGGLVYNFLTTNWDVIRVPGIRRAVVNKLRAVGPKELGALGTLVELRADANGILRPAPLQLPLDPAGRCAHRRRSACRWA